MWAYDQWGFWGAGVGTGSQGAYYFGAWDLVNGGAAEGGVGKVALELGFPGLSVVAWFAYALVRYLGRILDYLTARSPAHARFAYGLVAFLAANVATFFVATQVYGDVFILLILGWSLGFLLSLPVLVNHVPRPARSLAGFDRRHRQPIPCARSTAG